MAKKKNSNDTLQYLQMPLPSGGKFSKMTKVAFGGLNKRYTLDSGALTSEMNISTNEYPYLTPSNKKTEILSGYKSTDGYKYPISMFAFDDFIVVVYYLTYHEGTVESGETKKEIRIDYIKDDVVHTGIVKTVTDADDVNCQRSIVQFNVYDTPTDPLTGQFIKKLLIFPDKASMFMNIVKAESNPEVWESEYSSAEQDKKSETALSRADLKVMYYWEKDKIKYYYTVVLVKKTQNDEGYDANKVTYKRVVVKKHEFEATNDDNTTTTHTAENAFFCDGMDVLVKTYTNTASPYYPPDTASHNYYYRNTYDSLIYRWVDDESDSEKSGWKVSVPPTMPSLKYATVHLSRVFGVDDDRVYASGYNDYTNWNLDTTDEYNEANSWCSPSQSNTKAGGSFTGITTFDSHVICFKRDFMHEIYNTKNPFRLQDIYAEGCIDNRTIQNVDGKLIFVSEDDVKIYTGSNPRIIGYNLNMPQYEYAVSGTDNRNYYLYCEDKEENAYLYVYDTYTELWSERSIENRVISFAHNKNGMYMLCDNGKVYKLDGNDYSLMWSFETDLITNKTVDIKHIKKLQMLVDVDRYAYLKVYILYDDEGFEDLADDEKEKRLVYQTKNKFGRRPIRVKPRKTANYGFKLHIEGKGYVKLYELEIFVEAGGDMYV